MDARAGTLTNAFGLGPQGLGRLVADTVTLRGLANVFASGSNTTSWTWCRVSDMTVEGVGLAQVTIGQGALSPAFVECLFERIAGSIDVDTASTSIANLWSVIAGNGSSTFTTNNGTGGRAQVIVVISNFASLSMSPDDEVIGET